ncbi:hypothetical protein GCM10012275_64810 [Longimycelium tulufanense]|uniref:DUF1702 family protein n=1 Tax=Longimycelium tulufanense TaxID=907463 RepID=A0A8J3CJA9_9PSEU|nr:DUF1702 family protein [Longimycelium tulufanense]GGM85072.1 hypothetical protein GCM10012275_64810 [Longimycelium tulufanense]
MFKWMHREAGLANLPDHGLLTGTERGSRQVRNLISLPMDMADFEARGFRVDRPRERAILEGCARAFLGGFNIAAAHWKSPHRALAEVPGEKRGFAYEGAGMYAAMRDLVTAGRAGALRRLLAGPGDCYTHLVHVGAGWVFAPLGIRLPVPLPPTPLLRWLALDGAGFGATFFGGERMIRRYSRGRPDPHRAVRLAGCGRALWFVECADPDGVAQRIAEADEEARSHLWSGVGLAMGYAGAVGEVGRDRLAAAAGEYLAHFAQGLMFAAGARVRAGVVPEHTERACRQVLSVDAGTAAGWTEETAAGLGARTDLGAYLEWRSRLRARHS